jgi:predicted esterase
MRYPIHGWILWLIASSAFACASDVSKSPDLDSSSRQIKTLQYEGRSVQAIIDKPKGTSFDVLMVFHGTVQGQANHDALIMEAAETTRSAFRNLLDRQDVMIVSVAYPQANLLFGDNLVYAEAALKWLMNRAEAELGVDLKKIFLGGHSQGGYVVTRLNTLYPTDGVIANAPGPLNLVYRCELEENGQIQATQVCDLLRTTYGTTVQNPDAYFQRSLLDHVSGFKSDILFVQGLDDSPIQMYSWPRFKSEVQACETCQQTLFVELPGLGHSALFTSSEARTAVNAFINRN